MKKKMSILAALVLAVIVTGYSVSGTYAKYTSTFNGTSDTARVAKWAFKVGDLADSSAAGASNTFTFNLFDTIKDTDGSVEADVASKNTDKVIAPGTQGEFTIALQNLSEVTAMYGIDYTVVNDGNIPIEFSNDGSTWSNDITDVTASETTTKLAMNAGSDTEVTIKWRWAFDGNDTTDTDLGKVGLATVQVKADVTVTQVD